jgi:hypothetical protein
MGISTRTTPTEHEASRKVISKEGRLVATPQRPTNTAAAEWWEKVSTFLAQLAENAPHMLPQFGENDDPAYAEDERVMTPEAASDIEKALLDARTAADTAAGAYRRVVRAQAAAAAAQRPSAPHGPQQGWVHQPHVPAWQAAPQPPVNYDVPDDSRPRTYSAG